MSGDVTTLVPGLDVSRETELRLTAFADLVIRWTSRINLVASSSIGDLWQRHIIDSAQLYPLAPHWRHWADLGSGAGFPGIVVAIIAAELAPAAMVTMVESDQRKAVFLRTAVRELGLIAKVHAARAEELPPLAADVVSARALAPLSALLPLAVRHLAPGGIALFPKGRRADEEITAARLGWSFDLSSHPSLTDPDAQILKIERIVHA